MAIRCFYALILSNMENLGISLSQACQHLILSTLKPCSCNVRRGMFALGSVSYKIFHSSFYHDKGM